MARASTSTETMNGVGVPECAPRIQAIAWGPETADSSVGAAVDASAFVPGAVAQTPSACRPPAMGLNSNVLVNGLRFHVQTEDLWPSCAQIVSHVFEQSGRVVRVDRTDYSQHLAKPSLRQLLPKVMQVHHARALSRLSHSPESAGHSSDAHEQQAFDGPERSSGAFKISARFVWDRLVAEARREQNAGLALDPAAEAYRAGLEQMRQTDKARAVVSLARAVELEPQNRRYRASLRHALDWMDWHERAAR